MSDAATTREIPAAAQRSELQQSADADLFVQLAGISLRGVGVTKPVDYLTVREHIASAADVAPRQITGVVEHARICELLHEINGTYVQDPEWHAELTEKYL